VRDRFREAGIDTADLDARLLAQRAFGLDAMGLIRREREPAPSDWIEKLEVLADRRLRGEPISRIAGEREFWGLAFGLHPTTLVPRPETEFLVQEAIDGLQSKPSPRLVDLGTGSGAIAVSVLVSLPGATAMATDISVEALEMARKNAERHGVADRMQFRSGSWWQAVPHTEMFDLIVSNPPYIATEAIAGLAPEVRLFDPKMALDGGWDGLEAYRAIGAQAARRLSPGGRMLVEIGSNQGESVTRVLSRAGFGRLRVIKDYAGLDRVVVASHS
jgi:release factor glutamine methyltransferase